MYNKFFEKKYVIKSDNILSFPNYEPGDIVGFKRFFLKHEGKIIGEHENIAHHYLVRIYNEIHVLHANDFFLKPLQRRVLFEKCFRF